jgi:16S rRNA (cytosine1402-N4)-methyltransferase
MNYEMVHYQTYMNYNIILLYRTIVIYQLLLLIRDYNQYNMIRHIPITTTTRTRITLVNSYTLLSKTILWKKHMSNIARTNRNQYTILHRFDHYNNGRIIHRTTIQRPRQLQYQRYTTTTTTTTTLSSSFDDILNDTKQHPTDLSIQSNDVADISSITVTNEQQLQGQSQDPPNHQNHNQQNHQRRIRYNGKYPRHFNEKYKELNYDINTIQKKLLKGMTPAGQHIPIMIQECMLYLGFNHNDTTTTTTTTTSTDPIVFVDCTLGYGGHSMEVLRYILQQQQQQNNTNHHHIDHRMICLDHDPIELPKATERLYNIMKTQTATTIQPQLIVTTVHCNFRNLRTYIENENDRYNKKQGHGDGTTGTVTSLLADLGLSSMQIDDATRGFTYKYDGPLDMRMNTTTTDINNNINYNNYTSSTTTPTTMTAYELLCNVSVSELTRILHDNSDEEYASIIAKAIVGTKNNNNNVLVPSTTIELANLVRDTVRPYLLQKTTTTSTSTTKHNNNNTKNNKINKQQQQVPLTRDSAIMKKQLDAIVKRVMQAIRIEINHEFDSLQQLLDDLPHILQSPGGRAVILTFHSGEDRRVKKAFKDGYKKGIYSHWSRDVVRPTSMEQYNNPRSTCCKLRWVIRSDQTI